MGTSKSQCAQSVSMHGLMPRPSGFYRKDKEKFCCCLVTGDKTWIHDWDPESTMESMQWKHINCPHSKKFGTQPAAGKSHDNNFGDSEDYIW